MRPLIKIIVAVAAIRLALDYLGDGALGALFGIVEYGFICGGLIVLARALQPAASANAHHPRSTALLRVVCGVLALPSLFFFGVYPISMMAVAFANLGAISAVGVRPLLLSSLFNFFYLMPATVFWALVATVLITLAATRPAPPASANAGGSLELA